jgi:tRNA/rRNA methyltransferase
MLSVVLVRPKHPGNIGAIARLLANFNIAQLYLINPQCEITQESKNRAKNAQDILNNTKTIQPADLKQFDLVVGTTAQIGKDANVRRSPLHVREWAKSRNSKSNITLLFGNEGTGLTNNEIELCDVLITVPTSRSYHALNLSHAVAITLYEVFSQKSNPSYTPASTYDMAQVTKLLQETIESLEFPDVHKADTQRKTWRRIFAKSMLTHAESKSIMGFFKKLLGRR